MVQALDEATRQVRAIEATALDVRGSLLRLSERLDLGLNALQRLILRKGTNLAAYSPTERQMVRGLTETAALARELLECRLHTEAGAVNPRPEALLRRVAGVYA